MSESCDLYAPGHDVTAVTTAAVTGRRFVKISGNRSGGNIAVNHATAAGRVFGVARTDTDTGKLLDVMRGAGRVVEVDVIGTVAAFGEVEVGTDGTAVPLAAGVPVGYAVTGVTDDVGQISLY